MYRIEKGGKFVLIPHCALRAKTKTYPLGDPYATNLNFAYVVAHRVNGNVVDMDGRMVRPLRHLMKGVFPQDVNWDRKEVSNEIKNETE